MVASRERGIWGTFAAGDPPSARQHADQRVAQEGALAGHETVQVTSAEGDPLNCHRTLLVARALAERGLPIAHIERNGQPTSQADIEARLIRVVGLSDDLLRSRSELLAEAYDLQSKRVAYAERTTTAGADAV